MRELYSWSFQRQTECLNKSSDTRDCKKWDQLPSELSKKRLPLLWAYLVCEVGSHVANIRVKRKMLASWPYRQSKWCLSLNHAFYRIKYSSCKARHMGYTKNIHSLSSQLYPRTHQLASAHKTESCVITTWTIKYHMLGMPAAQCYSQANTRPALSLCTSQNVEIDAFPFTCTWQNSGSKRFTDLKPSCN